ncbi:MAG: hypothetical protein JWO67_6831, partial [Streptosporangiaceae bacterium]|nr:hypothetical protein [Streptosporangiaceae bacterium]
MAGTNNAPAAADITADGPDVAPDASGPVRPDGTAGAVWDALSANPGTSVMVIANAAGVSRATATKALTAFSEAGRAVRTPGGRGEGGRALPDT